MMAEKKDNQSRDNKEIQRKCNKNCLCCQVDKDNKDNGPQAPTGSTAEHSTIKIVDMDEIRFCIKNPSAAKELESFLDINGNDIVSLLLIAKDGKHKKIDVRKNPYAVIVLNHREFKYRMPAAKPITHNKRIVRFMLQANRKHRVSTEKRVANKACNVRKRKERAD